MKAVEISEWTVIGVHEGLAWSCLHYAVCVQMHVCVCMHVCICEPSHARRH